MKEIKIESIIDIINNLNIIDIRDKYSYSMGCIPNSKNVPMNYLLMNPEYYLDKNKTYYIYCNRGFNSKKVCEILTGFGYNTINIIGGYEEYKLIDK